MQHFCAVIIKHKTLTSNDVSVQCHYLQLRTPSDGELAGLASCDAHADCAAFMTCDTAVELYTVLLVYSACRADLAVASWDAG